MRDGPLAQRAPRALSRAGRVELLAECARKLLRSKDEASLFTGAVLLSWLEQGGPFERHARVGAPSGSHRRHSEIYRRLIRNLSSPPR